MKQHFHWMTGSVLGTLCRALSNTCFRFDSTQKAELFGEGHESLKNGSTHGPGFHPPPSKPTLIATANTFGRFISFSPLSSSRRLRRTHIFSNSRHPQFSFHITFHPTTLSTVAVSTSSTTSNSIGGPCPKQIKRGDKPIILAKLSRFTCGATLKCFIGSRGVGGKEKRLPTANHGSFTITSPTIATRELGTQNETEPCVCPGVSMTCTRCVLPSFSPSTKEWWTG